MTVDPKHPEVAALTKAGINIDRLNELTNAKPIKHAAVTQEVVVPQQQQASIPAPTLDTADLQAAEAMPAAFTQQLENTAAYTPPVPQAQAPKPTDPDETSDQVYQAFVNSLGGTSGG